MSIFEHMSDDRDIQHDARVQASLRRMLARWRAVLQRLREA